MPNPTATTALAQQTEIQTLQREITEKIARLRAIADDPVDIAYAKDLSFEIRPANDSDCLVVYRKGWGSAQVNYRPERLEMKAYHEGILPECVHHASFVQEDLEDPQSSEAETQMRGALEEVGYSIEQNPDGPWRWFSPSDSCMGSFGSSRLALKAAWDDAVDQIMAMHEGAREAWGAISLDQQLEYIEQILGGDRPLQPLPSAPASAL